MEVPPLLRLSLKGGAWRPGMEVPPLLPLSLKGGVIGQWKSRRFCDFPSRGE